MFAADLMASAIGALPFDVVANTLRRLAGEIDPDDISLAKLIEAVKTRPVVPERRRLPEPEIHGESPTERGIRWATRAGIQAPPPRMEERAQMADRMLRIGLSMGLVCFRCHRQMGEDDLLAHIHELMHAGARGEDAPERLCIPCRPEAQVSDDVAVPF